MKKIDARTKNISTYEEKTEFAKKFVEAREFKISDSDKSVSSLFKVYVFLKISNFLTIFKFISEISNRNRLDEKNSNGSKKLKILKIRNSFTYLKIVQIELLFMKKLKNLHNN
jgi:hypothetical protein